MKQEIVEKIGSINISDTTLVYGDGNLKIKRGSSQAKHLHGSVSYPQKCMWNLFLVKEKRGKKINISKIVFESSKSKIEGLTRGLLNKNLNIVSGKVCFSGGNAYNEISAVLNSPQSYSKNETYKKIIDDFKKCEFDNQNFYYENGCFVINNITNGSYKIYYMHNHNETFSLIFEKKEDVIEAQFEGQGMVALGPEVPVMTDFPLYTQRDINGFVVNRDDLNARVPYPANNEIFLNFDLDTTYAPAEEVVVRRQNNDMGTMIAGIDREVMHELDQVIAAGENDQPRPIRARRRR